MILATVGLPTLFSGGTKRMDRKQVNRTRYASQRAFRQVFGILVVLGLQGSFLEARPRRRHRSRPAVTHRAPLEAPDEVSGPSGEAVDWRSSALPSNFEGRTPKLSPETVEDTSTLERWRTRGNGALEAGLLEVAQLNFENILRVDPNDSEARFNLASLALKQNQPEVALRHYQILERDPEEGSDARFSKAVVLLQIGRTREALSEFSAIVKARPDYPEARLRLGQIFSNLGRLEEARLHFEEARTLVPEDPAPWAGLARLAWQGGHFEEAQVLLNAAIDRDPENWSVLEDSGDLALQRQQYEEATQYFRSALHQLSLHPEDTADVFMRQARIQDKLGSPGEARLLLEKALAINPRHTESLELAPKILGARGRELLRKENAYEASLFDSGGTR